MTETDTLSDALETVEPEAQPTGRRCSICGETGHNARTCTAGDAVQITSPDDAPAQPRSLRSKVKGWMTVGSGETETRATRGGGKSDEFAAGFILPLLTLAMFAVPVWARATHAEQTAVAQPLARIILRHFKAARRLSGDLIDLVAILAAVVAYGMRIDMERKTAAMQAQAYAAPVGSGPNGHYQAGAIVNPNARANGWDGYQWEAVL